MLSASATSTFTPFDASTTAAPELPAPVAGGGAGLSIGLIAHVGMQNLGDEIMFAATLAYYRARLPKARFVAFTMDPDDTKARYGLAEAYRIRPPAGAGPRPGAGGRLGAYLRTVRDLAAQLVREGRFGARALQRLRRLDFVIVPGSSQFIDAYGGPTGFPLALLRWTAFARLLRVPICYLSMGAEQLEHPASRWMVRRTVQMASFISLRDMVSRDRLTAQGVRRAIPVAPDLSLAYPWDPSRDAGNDRRATVGINPIPYYHPIFWRSEDHARYRRYLEAMVDLTAAVLERGHDVVLYGTTQWADHVPVRDICTAIGERLGVETLKRVRTPEVHTLDDLRAVLAGVDWVVASRYHGVATALLMRRPAVGIAYERKTADLMDNLGLAAHSIDIDDIDGTTLFAMLDRLQADDAATRTALDAHARAGRARVHSQFEEVLRMYGSNPAEA